MSVCSGKAYEPQLCKLQFTIPQAYYVTHLVWLIVHVARVKIVSFLSNLTTLPPPLPPLVSAYTWCRIQGTSLFT